MNSSLVKLGEIAKVFNGKTPAESEQRQSGFPVLKIKDVDENGVFRGQFDSFVDEELANQFPEKQICVNDVMTLNAAHNADYVASKMFFANERVAGALSTGEWLIIRADKDKVDPQFIHYWLQDSRTRYKLRLLVKGIHLYPKDVAELNIPLPPLTEQKRIASLLARADRLRHLRRTAHDLGESLLQSMFLEMFGKVGEKTKEAKLGEISDIASGVTKGQNYNGRKTVEVPYLRVANVQDGYLDLSEMKTIQALPSEVEELRLHVGDVVMTEGGDFDKLGRGAIWRGQIENCIHQNHIFRVRLERTKVLPEFFENYLLSPEAKNYFLGASKQTTNLASINMTQLKQLPVPLYPLNLQEEFAVVMARVESLRGRMSEGERQVEGLFGSLLNESFG